MNDISRLQRKVDDLSDLLKSLQKLNTAHNLDDVLSEILLKMMTIMETEAGTLWLLDDTKNVIEARVVEGPSKQELQNMKLQRNEGIVGKVVESGEPHSVENAGDEPVWTDRVDQSSGFRTRSMITVPLIARGKSLGALQMLNKRGRKSFTSEDMNLCLSLANQAAISLLNSEMYRDMYRMTISMIRTLIKTIDAKDHYTAGHSNRVAFYSLKIAERLGLKHQQLEELERAALLHDIGKVGIPDHILGKTSRLTKEEFSIVKQHPVIGDEILSEMEPKHLMATATKVARYHHERMDGSGYPDGLSGDDIPFYAQIVGVADSFDAMTADRPYQKGRPFQVAAEELVRCKGTLYRSDLVDIFVSILKESEFHMEPLFKTTMNPLSNGDFL